MPLGCDEVTLHDSISIRTALDGPVIIPAPPAGFYLCVYKLSGSVSGTSLCKLQDGVPNVYWQMAAQAYRPYYDYDKHGLFSLPAATALVLGNTALATVIVNATFEHRPVGL